MESAKQSDCIGQIGEVSGQVWQALSEVEATTLAKLIRSIDAPRDMVMQAVGWLARRQNRNQRGNARPHDFADRIRAATGGVAERQSSCRRGVISQRLNSTLGAESVQLRNAPAVG